MKRINIQFYRVMLILVLIFFSLLANAQSQKKYLPQGTSDFLLTVQNLTQTTPNILEFDVYLLSTIPSGQPPFELATMQLAFLINASIHTGGILTLSLSNAGSGLNPAIQFIMAGAPMVVSPLTTYPTKTLIRQQGQSPQGTGNSTIISNIAPGTKLVHYILTSSVNFKQNSVPDLSFISTSEPSMELYITSISEYINLINTNLIVTSGVDALVNGNPVLNPVIAAFDVAGSGSYCQNTGGLPVSLSGSEAGVTYTLYDGVTPLTPTVVGTGSSVSFGNQLAGTYTISGNMAGSYNGSKVMTGAAIITENPVVTPGVNITVTQNPINANIPVTFTASPTGEGTLPSYQWYIGTSLAGSNSSVFSYIPTDGDKIKVEMISNALCADLTPVTSNVITMSVSLGTSFEKNKIVSDIYSFEKNIVVSFTQRVKQVIIYNTLGSMIVTDFNVSGIKKFNLNTYPCDYYFIKIVTDHDVYTQKILLK